MFAFRLFLLLQLVVLSIYTLLVLADQGTGFVEIFLSDIVAMSWPGQFNLDFLCTLLLAGLWVAWRHEFSPVGWVLALCTSTGGVLFLATYLLVESYRVKGDTQALLLGAGRV